MKLNLQVFCYQMLLWAEHLACLEPVFEQPKSFECVQRINHMADRNWEQYVAQEVIDMKGHLIRYPLKLEDNGTVTNFLGCWTFPDVGG